MQERRTKNEEPTISDKVAQEQEGSFVFVFVAVESDVCIYI